VDRHRKLAQFFDHQGAGHPKKPALPNNIQGQVLNALERIAAAPHRGQKLTQVTVGKWRYRAGSYRIRYDIEGQDVVLHVVRLRKGVYRRWSVSG